MALPPTSRLTPPAGPPLLSSRGSFFLPMPATLSVGNVKPIGEMPEGTIICNLEEKPGDRGVIARASGNYATVIAHNPDTGEFCCRPPPPRGGGSVLHSHHLATGGAWSHCLAMPNPTACDFCLGKSRVRLPSGNKKTVMSSCRAMVGVIAGGGRIDKPLLKASRAMYKYKAKRNCWPVVRGVAMNVRTGSAPAPAPPPPFPGGGGLSGRTLQVSLPDMGLVMVCLSAA